MCRCLIFPYVVDGFFDRFLAVGRLALSGSRTLVRKTRSAQNAGELARQPRKNPDLATGGSTIAYEGTGFPLKPAGSGLLRLLWNRPLDRTGKRLNTHGRPSLPFVDSHSRGTFPQKGFCLAIFCHPYGLSRPRPIVNDHPCPTSVHKRSLRENS